MADCNRPESNSMKKKKRKVPDSNEKPLKSSRKNQSIIIIEEEEDSSLPWRNLQLILSLNTQNPHLLNKQVELAYGFVNSDSIHSPEAVTFERVILFLNNWVQSTLISAQKKLSLHFGVTGSCFDYRCWEVFKFCLDEGAKRHLFMGVNRDILRVVHCVAENTQVKDFNDDELTLYNTILDCISSVFVSHGGVSNENLDLWILVAGTVLELVLKVITNKGEDSRSGGVVLSLVCLVFEPFTKFLRLHPNKKSGFHDFVDKLLEPLLYLLYLTHQSVSTTNHVWVSKLLKLNEEVLCQGLFHSSHIDGFMSLQSLTKYKVSDDGKQKDSKTVIKSFHRHLFDKLGRIVVEKKAFALFGVGELFRLFVHCIKSQNEPAFSSEIRKSLFDFFVQVMEPFLGDIDTYLKDEMEVGSVLEDVHCTLKSVNSILISLIEEKVYVRVDDTSEGACGEYFCFCTQSGVQERLK